MKKLILLSLLLPTMSTHPITTTTSDTGLNMLFWGASSAAAGAGFVGAIGGLSKESLLLAASVGAVTGTFGAGLSYWGSTDAYFHSGQEIVDETNAQLIVKDNDKEEGLLGMVDSQFSNQTHPVRSGVSNLRYHDSQLRKATEYLTYAQRNPELSTEAGERLAEIAEHQDHVTTGLGLLTKSERYLRESVKRADRADAGCQNGWIIHRSSPRKIKVTVEEGN
jgi:uncharacterized membrane protein